MALKILSLSTVTLLVTLTYLCVQSSILILAPYISSSFFPADSFLGSLAFTFLGFFLGFMIRPIGAIIFGSIADKAGRKVSLTYGLLGASAVAFSISLIPDYNSIGLLSSIFFIIIQLLLGIFSGGISAAGNTMGPEIVPEKFRGFTSGLAGSNGGFSFLISTFFFLISYSTFPTLGWRFVFILEGIFSLAILIYFRYFIAESEIFLMARKRSRKLNLWDREIRKKFLKALFLTVGWALMFYATQGTLSTFLEKEINFNQYLVGITLTFSSTALIISAIIGGTLSQIFGRRMISIIGGIIVLIFSPLYLQMVSQNQFNVILYVFLIAFATQFGQGMLTVYVAESFPTEVRGRGVGLTWNIGYGIGSLAPLIAIEISDNQNLPFVLFLFTLAIGIMIILGSIIGGETRGAIEKEQKV
jgi:Arabinose efflux permease